MGDQADSDPHPPGEVTSGPLSRPERFLLTVHAFQLNDDTRYPDQMRSYLRAMFAAVEGNKAFVDEQKIMAQEAKSLVGVHIHPVKISDVPKVQFTRKGRRGKMSITVADVGSGDDEIEISWVTSETLEEHLCKAADRQVGYHRIGLVSFEGKDLIAAWDGQFLSKVDIKRKSLFLKFSKFVPEFSESDLVGLRTGNISVALKAEMRRNLCRFEMSREFAINIPLLDIQKICLRAPNDLGGKGYLVIEFSPGSKVKFLQRHIATNLKQHNQWKSRSNIFVGKKDTSGPFHLVVGSSNFQTAAQLVAEMMLVEPKLRDVYVLEEDVLLPFVKTTDESMADICPVDAVPEETTPPKKKIRITSKKAQRRRAILDTLVDLNLITKQKADLVYDKPRNLEEDDIVNKAKINNYLGGLSLETCFNEYLNFKCESAADLLNMVHKKLDAEDYGLDDLVSLGLGLDEDDEERMSDENNNDDSDENKNVDSDMDGSEIAENISDGELELEINDKDEGNDDDNFESSDEDHDEVSDEDNNDENSDDEGNSSIAEDECANSVQENGGRSEDEDNDKDMEEHDIGDEDEDEDIKKNDIGDEDKDKDIEENDIGDEDEDKDMKESDIGEQHEDMEGDRDNEERVENSIVEGNVNMDDMKDDRREEPVELSEFHQLTALDLLKKQKHQGTPVFFSYCRGYIVESDYRHHCTRCHECRGWRMWHCDNCDNCSYGMTIADCDTCGVPCGEGWFDNIRPALEIFKRLESYEKLLRTLAKVKSSGEIDFSSDNGQGKSDDDEDEDDGSWEDTQKERARKGWIFSDDEDDAFPSPLKV